MFKIFLILAFILFISHKLKANENATYYGDKYHGKITASGEIFNKNELTAAHRTLKLGTLVEVTNLRNGKSVVVRINDRLPPNSKATVDLSEEAFKTISELRIGRIPIKLTILNQTEN